MIQFYGLRLSADEIGWLLAVAKKQPYEYAAPVIDRISAQIADQDRAAAKDDAGLNAGKVAG